MACDPNELLEDAKCYLSCFTGEMYEAAMIYLLCKIRDSETVECDPAVIASDPDFTCIMTCIPRGARAAVIVSLLCDIAAAGGGGGGDFPLEWEPSSVDIGPWFGLQAFNDTPTFVGVTSMTFKMETLNESIDIESADDLVTMTFDALTGFGATCTPFINGNGALTSISLPLMVSAAGGISVTNNAALTSFSAPVWLPTNNTANEFNGNALSAASVNAILARGVASAGFALGTLVLTGGTNAAPTGQGILDKATLNGRGVTCTTN